jgi:hypothetical protein
MRIFVPLLHQQARLLKVMHLSTILLTPNSVGDPFLNCRMIFVPMVGLHVMAGDIPTIWSDGTTLPNAVEVHEMTEKTRHMDD